jgi:hypothetical protein
VYAISAGSDDEAAFAWRVPGGIEIPNTGRRAIELDNENGNTLWQDAVAKELKNVKITFKVLEEGTNVPAGNNLNGCHLIITMKIDGFQ